MACYQNVVKTQAPKTKIKTKTSTLSLETSRDQDSIKSQEPHHWILSAVVGPVYIELNPKCELSCSYDFRDKQGVLKLMVGALAPMYHIPDNVISATVDLLYINLQPEYELPSSTRFGQFPKFGKTSWGHCIPRSP